MKYIKIFLASSIVEFKHEREEFGTFIRRLNNIYAKRDIYFELIVCEDMTKELHNKRMQDVYNDEIKDSHYFYIIVGKELGERSLEEFDVALENFISTGVPKIMTYFYEVSRNSGSYSNSVQSFMERLDKNLGHDYNLFSHFDSIKLDFLMSMHQDPELGANISFADGEASLDGVSVMPLTNVPVYGKNKSLNDLRAQKEELDSVFSEIAIEYANNINDKSLYDKLTDVSERRAHVADSLRKAESDVLALYTDIFVFKSGKRKKTWREEKAVQLVDSGDFEGALYILRDNERKKELSQAQDIISGQMDVVKGYIQENMLRINTLRASGLNEERIHEIDECYDEIVNLAVRYNLNEDYVYDYAEFLLYEKRDYDKAVLIANKLYETNNQEHVYLEAMVSEIIACAMLDGKHDLKRSIEYRERAIGYFTESANTNKWYRLVYNYDILSRAYRIAGKKELGLDMALKSLKIATEKCNSKSSLIEAYILLSGAYSDVNDSDGRNKYADLAYERASEMYERSHDDYNTLLFVGACSLKGRVLQDEKKYQEAKENYELCLNLNKKLYQHDPYTSMNHLESAYSDYARILSNLYLYQDAVENYRSAVELTRKLCEINPVSEAIFLSSRLHCYGNALRNIYRFEDALSVHKEAVTIRKGLLGRDNVHIWDVLFSSRSLAEDLSDLEMYDEADKVYLECIELSEKSAIENPEKYNREPNLSKRNYAWFLCEIGRSDEAKQISDLLLVDERNYSSNMPIDKKYSLVWTLNCCGFIEYKLDNYEKSEEYFLEALDIIEAYYKGNEDEGELDISGFCTNLAMCLYLKGDYDRAEIFCEKAYEIRKRMYDAGREGMDNYLRNVCVIYANILNKMNSDSRAQSLYIEGLGLAEKLYGICPKAFISSLAEVKLSYAQFLMKLDNAEDAKPFAEEAFNLYHKLMGVCEKIYKKKFKEANELYIKLL